MNYERLYKSQKMITIYQLIINLNSFPARG